MEIWWAAWICRKFSFLTNFDIFRLQALFDFEKNKSLFFGKFDKRLGYVTILTVLDCLSLFCGFGKQTNITFGGEFVKLLGYVTFFLFPPNFDCLEFAGHFSTLENH